MTVLRTMAVMATASAGLLLPARAAASAFDTLAPMDSVRTLLAAPAGFRPDDFDLMMNHRGAIPRAPSPVLALLRSPARVDSLVPALRRIAPQSFAGRIAPQSFAGRIAPQSFTGRIAPQPMNARASHRDDGYALVSSAALWPWLDVELMSPDGDGFGQGPGSSRQEDRSHPASRTGSSLAAPPTSSAPFASSAPSKTVATSATSPTSIADLVRRGERHMKAYAASLTADEHVFLRREAPTLFRYNADDTLRTPVEREQGRVRVENVLDSVMSLAASLPLPTLAQASREFDTALDAMLDAALADSGRGGFTSLRSLLLSLRREGIPVVFGTPGDDVHHLDALLAPLRRGIVFDPGGNDRYILSGMAQPGAWLIILDAAGDDVYHAGAFDDSTAGAAAFASVQVIADLAGNDRYEGGDFAFGAALAGYARVYDAAGDDVYRARAASLGFAFHGLGILQDREGNDVYSTAFLSQGASSTFGFGLLLDEAGDDAYITRPEFLDDLRYRDRFLSLSQGFSSGFAPRYGGGLGVLWDRAGNDRYVADIYGQGSGYWFAWGLLMDDDGHDSLTAWQYAQGAGVHFAAGMLLDGDGDDVRAAKGVSQGCGHDGGFGLLVDAAGDDHNTAVDMSAGAGSANGLGVFLDASGDDVYAMGNHAMTLGHGDMRRDRPSMGFFLDLGGRNEYSGAGPGTAEHATASGAAAPGTTEGRARPGEKGAGGEVPSQGSGTVTGGAAGRAAPAATLPSGRAVPPAARMQAPTPGSVWHVYDGVRRGHGFGLDRGGAREDERSEERSREGRQGLQTGLRKGAHEERQDKRQGERWKESAP